MKARFPVTVTFVNRDVWRAPSAPALFLLGVALAAIVGAGSGCHKIENRHEDFEDRRGLVFFNYVIPNTNVVAADVAPDRLKGQPFAGRTLRVLAWEHYFPHDVLESFTSTSGADIVVSTCKTNEELIERLTRKETVDLVVPSDFAVQQLIEAGLLRELPADRYRKAVHPDFLKNSYDPGGRYSVPYLWGCAGVAYNFSELPSLPRSWKFLFEPVAGQEERLHGRTALLSEPAMGLAAVLLRMGHSPNTPETNYIRQAAAYLLEKKQSRGLQFLDEDSLVRGLATEQILLAECYSGDAAQAQKQNRKIRFFLPEEGYVYYVQCLAIPKATDAGQAALAEAFINFLLEPEVAAEIVKYALHATTVSGAMAFLSGDIVNGPAYLLPRFSEKGFELEFNPLTAALRTSLWQGILLAPGPGPIN